MSAAALLTAVRRESGTLLRWQVMRALGIAPLSLRAALLTRRRVLLYAALLLLERGAGTGEDDALVNPNFDMARYAALAGG